jgi:hypothetical protein
MRAAIEGHIGRGGNVAFLTGNTAYYRVHFTDGDTALTCAKVLPAAKDPDRWVRDSWTEADPESRVIGVTTAFGGGWWDGKRDTQGYVVQHAGHWVFAGTGLAEGAIFGDDPDYPLIGYEVDGAAFRRRNGRALPTGELGTPRDFVILGIAELTEGWFVSRPGAAATMGLYVSPQGGIVFQAATTDWPILVPRNAHVAAITRNVLDRLRLPSLRIMGPLPIRAGRMLAAAGETVSFHVDLGELEWADDLALGWRVVGADLVEDEGPQIRVALPARADFVTVSVELRRGATAIGFSTRTFMPLTDDEAARLAVLIDLRELAIPDEPSSPLVTAAFDPLDRVDVLTPVHLPWLEERAARLQQTIARVIRAMPEKEDS